MPAATDYLLAPLISIATLAVIVLIMRWAFTGGRSLVSRPVRPASPAEYGMLVAIFSPADHIEGERVRRQLLAAGVRATLAWTLEGPRVLVWPVDEPRARQLLGGKPGTSFGRTPG